MLFIINKTNNKGCGGTTLLSILLYLIYLLPICLSNGTALDSSLNVDHSHHQHTKHNNRNNYYHHHHHHHQNPQEKKGEQVQVQLQENGSSSKHVHPHVAAYLKDYKSTSVVELTPSKIKTTDGDVSSPSSTPHPTIILPHLPIQDYIWEGFSIQLLCNFSQPVQWLYFGQGAPLVKHETYRLPTSDKTKDEFGAKVIFTHTNYKQTGRFVCVSVENSHIFSDLFVYSPGEKIFVNDDDESVNNSDRDSGDGSSTSAHNKSNSKLRWNETEISIDADSLNQWIQLPCSVSSPNASVQLFKDGRKIEMVRKKTFFDPTVGFELLKESLSSPYGKYLCYESHTKQRLVVNVNPPKYVLSGDAGQKKAMEKKVSNYTEGENPFEGSQKHSTHIKFHHDKRRDMIVCCAYDSQGRSMRRYPTMKSASCDSVAECHMLKRHLNRRKCSNNSRQRCEGRRLKRHCMGYELAHDMDDAGILECALDDREDTREYFQFSRMNDHFISNFDEVPRTEDILEIIVEDSKNPEKKIITCLSNTFFFSHGIQWAVRLGDDEKITYLNQDDSKISIEVNSGENSIFYCFAPIWNSHQWRNTSVYLS